MSSFKLSRALLRGLPWVGLAAGALLACATPSEDDSEEGAITGGNCKEQQEAFIDGSTSDFAVVRDRCNQDVTEYVEAQPQNFDWFKNSPLGLAGPPLGVLLAMMDDQEIWPANTLGLAPDPNAKEDKSHPTMGLPYGMVYAANPETHLRHVFFSCAGCHTGRVVGPDGKVQMVHGAPNTEVDAQMFGWRLRESMLGRPGGKEGYVKAELDANGDYVFDDEGYPKFTVTESGKAFKHAAIAKTAKLPGIFQGDATESAVYLIAWEKVMKKLAAGAVRTDMSYRKLTMAAGSYPEDASSPKRVGPRPGMMDAYGFASGLVYSHAARDDYFMKIKARYGADYANHPFFAGLVTAGQSDQDLFAKARARIRDNPSDWLNHEPAPVDVKSLFNLADRPNVGWDANQATSARVLASGTSSVGDPWNVNLPVHQGMNQFITALPAAAYPFEVDAALARAGAPIFEAKCATCHKPGNAAVYPLAAIGTDPNRANVASPIARAGLVELIREACDGTGDGVDLKRNVSLEGYKATYSNDWCTPKGANGETLTLKEQDNELWRERAVRGNPNVGYKADDLRGIWAQAPYLHNGSVPTLWHLLNPSERLKAKDGGSFKFVRGNINYDKTKVGFAWEAAAATPTNYPVPHTSVYDTGLRGQSSAGHTFGSELSGDEKTALIEYLKTL